tara:strand:+ start:5262 stop:6476 length:1215 start_codon:yes stop_codon:yes gene_type:complete
MFMQKIILDNGITLIINSTDSVSIAIQATIKVGSNHETDKTRGISHFIEHLLFEGTKNRTGHEIASAIEGVGGDIGAFTSNTRTAYHIKVLKKHFPIAVDVLGDMLMHPLFDKKAIEKERKIILSEISMRKDEPRSHQWELFQKGLFKNFPAQHPIIGYEQIIKKLSQKEFKDHYTKYYVGSNIIITLSGKVDSKDIALVSREFSKILSKSIENKPLELGYMNSKSKTVKEKRDIQHSYLVYGCQSVPRGHEDSYVFDVIEAILGRPLSGRLFRYIRQEKGLCYDIGAHYEDEIGYGFFAVYLSTTKNKLKEAEKLLQEQINKVDSISNEELKEVKQFLEGDYLLSMEDNEKRVDDLAFWEYAGSVLLSQKYVGEIKKVTIKDIFRVKKKYLKNFTKAIIEQGK